MTAAEKEAQIMKEIRSAAANKKKPVRKFQGSFLGHQSQPQLETMVDGANGPMNQLDEIR